MRAFPFVQYPTVGGITSPQDVDYFYQLSDRIFFFIDYLFSSLIVLGTKIRGSFRRLTPFEVKIKEMVFQN